MYTEVKLVSFSLVLRFLKRLSKIRGPAADLIKEKSEERTSLLYNLNYTVVLPLPHLQQGGVLRQDPVASTAAVTIRILPPSQGEGKKKKKRPGGGVERGGSPPSSVQGFQLKIDFKYSRYQGIFSCRYQPQVVPG